MSSLPSLTVRAQPWRDRAGRLSWLKAVTFACLFLPGLLIALSWGAGWLGPKPVTDAIHSTGEWAVRFLIFSLAVTPLRRIGQWNRLILIRRMLGLAVLAYLLIHFTLYVIDLHFDLVHVASEIALRIYLTIGFVALVGFCVLGSTSTDAMIRRIGPQRWNQLHRIVYVLAILGLLHFFMQAKLDVTQPTLMAGIFILLMGQRLLARWKMGDQWGALIGLALASGLLTALLEAGWYKVASGVPPERVLEADLDFSGMLRPAWWVLAVGLGLVVLRLARRLWSAPPRTSVRPPGSRRVPV
ncbi:protein-methionine-sulfoxide reductase heme-binding subunit MsrQ [Lichenifustis flavocetrariae]|uniref:Protein-methionine-sulfoxide reductase heme-binding subunit MsrQ n=1 Tax=Lichenifustis flavocetrariae TaxID=2949735 RepID=A0AA42CGD1_9HYPH|nr:protein-methionine-sulfoxide reductase heme-binding subunit MsrQ [Lichenifustis flavocetrariae]MCW6506468.1 sulfoxide reductase heme-binding subunit YedZ [Lichenifustis flavocetrariae]